LNDSYPLSEVSLNDNYSTSESSLLEDFFAPVLSNAVTYDRAAGYFSSALFAITPIAFANFIEHGGLMRLICSPQLSSMDKDAILNSNSIESLSVKDVIHTLRNISNSGSDGLAVSKAFSALIFEGILEIKLAIPDFDRGIYHDKVGVFSSGEDVVSFIGSANETAAAWSGFNNHEQIEVFASWRSEEQRIRANRHKKNFEQTWRGAKRGLRIIPSSQINDAIFNEIAPEPLHEVLASVRSQRTMSTQITKQKSPGIKILAPHQVAALRSWNLADRKGIIAFATGGGKTLAAIGGIRECSETNVPALVLVPSVLLHEQWYEELVSELPNHSIIRFGASFSTSGNLGVLRTALSNVSKKPVVVLSTYATAQQPDFLSVLSGLSDYLLVADEVHTAGSAENIKLLDAIDPKFRLGLSATPERFGDPIGTEAIFSFFGEIVEPRFTIRDAIESGRLVNYSYDFETVSLTDEEMTSWNALSVKIAMLMSNSNSNPEMLRNLLLKRARLLKAASGKPSVARRVLNKRFKSEDRWLVYCQDQQQMADVRADLERASYKNLLEYHMNMDGDSKETLNYFRRNGGILLAIKCLDEGIDIPEIDHALILASSNNPREYVQRRGRILRTAPNKFTAELIDTLVTRPDGTLLSIGEAKRAKKFLEDSSGYFTTAKLQSLLIESGISEEDLED
jgi:superfamily II DNA or RNA helicase